MGTACESSLFLSTLRAYFEGKKELFKGLKIMELEGDGPDAWQKYPVFYFDFNKDEYKREAAIESVLEGYLQKWEEQTASSRLRNMYTSLNSNVIRVRKKLCCRSRIWATQSLTQQISASS